MDKEYMQEVARVTISILKDHGCVRRADNLSPDGMFMDDLLQQLADHGHPITQQTYYDVRLEALEMGYPIVANGKGQYIGSKGEWIRLLDQAVKQVNGRVKRQKKALNIAGETMDLNKGNEYAVANFGKDLIQYANMLKGLGEVLGDRSLPWPEELVTYLLEAKNKTD